MADAGVSSQDLTGLVGQIVRLSGPVSRVMARELRLPLNDLAALHHLVGLPPAGPAELGRRLGMSSASATVLADRLERAGYVRRRRDPSDRRRVVLEVSKSAANRSLTAIAPLIDAVDAISANVDGPTRQRIGDFLSRVISVMIEFAGADVGERPG